MSNNLEKFRRLKESKKTEEAIVGPSVSSSSNVDRAIKVSVASKKEIPDGLTGMMISKDTKDKLEKLKKKLKVPMTKIIDQMIKTL